MEAPLSAREFLKRFHLPQLVRISNNETSGETLDRDGVSVLEETGRHPNDRLQVSGKHVTISSSFASNASSEHQPQQQRGDCSIVNDEFEFSASSGPRSLAVAANLSDEHEKENQFSSISAWSSQQVDRMVARANRATAKQQQQPPTQLIRVPRASLAGGTSGQQETRRPQASAESSAKRRNWSKSIKLTPPSKRPSVSKLSLEQPFLLYKAHKKLEVCAYAVDSKNELCGDKSGDPIYLPHNYPGWFLITSGADASQANKSHQHQRSRPIETIDQVCRSSAQIFITRDELVGHRLPQKLSQVTKLKNNQLLALPLAINLGDIDANQTTSPSDHLNRGKSPKKDGGKDKSNISDIRQILIGPGQALRICGVYEDVMPLIEQNGKLNKTQQSATSGKQQQVATNQSLFYHQHQVANDQQPQSITYYNPHHVPIYGNCYANNNQLASIPPAYQQHLQSPPITSSQSHQYFNHHHNQPQVTGDKRSTIIKTAHGQSAACTAPNRPYGAAAPPLIYAGAQSPQPVAAPSQQHKVTNCHQEPPQGQSVVRVGRRYARCVLLNDKSLQAAIDGTIDQKPNKEEQQDERPEEEVEVLLPIETRGRFYLCATSQTVIDEVYSCQPSCCQPSKFARRHSSSRSQPTRVFRLSQIISLINLTKRLAMANEQQAKSDPSNQRVAQTGKMALTGSGCRLPIHVQLVIGPRPANFSPSMFGTSSTMESYFQVEQNVGGHLLGCRYNLNWPPMASKVTEPLATSEANKSACHCAQKLFKVGEGREMYGLFSGELMIERIVKRDVLLACTIKRSPLVHLDLSKNCLGDSSSGNQDSLGELRVNNKNKKFQKTVGYALSKQMVSLRESESQLDAGKSLGKGSSFSKLKACRSLISLNGRRNAKKRPTIPSSMMSGTDDGNFGRSLDFESYDLRSPGGAHGGNTNMGDSSSGGDTNNSITSSDIIFIELDCNDQQLNFVRTFVESSIPTASIPDLVLNRMEYCQRNSQDWERQLKLSYETLGRDFDSCQRQMLMSMVASRPAANCHHLLARPVERKLLVSPTGQHTNDHQINSLDHPNLIDYVFMAQVQQQQQQQQQTNQGKLMLKSSKTHQSETRQLVVTSGSQINATTSRSIDSTAASSSSRSSSGVSSAGERLPSGSNSNSSSNNNTNLDSGARRQGVASLSMDHLHTSSCSSSSPSSSPATTSSSASSSSVALVGIGAANANSRRASESLEVLAGGSHQFAAPNNGNALANSEANGDLPVGRSQATLASSELAAQDSAVETKKPAASSQPPNRILRLVHKILPPRFNRLANGENSGAAGDGANQQLVATCSRKQQQQQQVPPLTATAAADRQRRLMDEMNARFNCSSTCSSSAAAVAQLAAAPSKTRDSGHLLLRARLAQREQLQTLDGVVSRAEAKRLQREQQQVGATQAQMKTASERQQQESTLMNAQKVHRRLMRSVSARHLSPDGWDFIKVDEGERQAGRRREPARPRDSSQQGDEDTGSHLYESLERLNEARLGQARPAAAAAASASVASAAPKVLVGTCDSGEQNGGKLRGREPMGLWSAAKTAKSPPSLSLMISRDRDQDQEENENEDDDSDLEFGQAAGLHAGKVGDGADSAKGFSSRMLLLSQQKQQQQQSQKQQPVQPQPRLARQCAAKNSNSQGGQRNDKRLGGRRLNLMIGLGRSMEFLVNSRRQAASGGDDDDEFGDEGAKCSAFSAYSSASSSTGSSDKRTRGRSSAKKSAGNSDHSLRGHNQINRRQDVDIDVDADVELSGQLSEDDDCWWLERDSHFAAGQVPQDGGQLECRPNIDGRYTRRRAAAASAAANWTKTKTQLAADCYTMEPVSIEAASYEQEQEDICANRIHGSWLSLSLSLSSASGNGNLDSAANGKSKGGGGGEPATVASATSDSESSGRQ